MGLHLVWCPEYRRWILGGLLCGVVGADRLRARLADLATDVMPDHAHLFVRVGPSDAPASMVRAFKGRAATVLRPESAYLGNRAKVLRSPSYFAAPWAMFGTGRRYIKHQSDAVTAS